MLYCRQNKDNSGRYQNGRYGRSGWDWNTKSKTVCPRCCIHVVTGGNCPKCGAASVHVSKVPRNGSRKSRNVKRFWFRQELRYASDYPTAIPRRWPRTGAPPKL